MDDVSLNSAGRLFQMTAADTANALAPTTVLVTDSFMVSAERRMPQMTSTGYCADQDAVVCQTRLGKTVKALEDDHDELFCIRCRMGSSAGVMWSNFICAGHNTRAAEFCIVWSFFSRIG